MNTVWNLDPIYLGFEDPGYRQDLQSIRKKIEEYGLFVKSLDTLLPSEGLRRGLELEEEIAVLSERLTLYASLRQAADSRDNEAMSQMGNLMGIFSELAAPQAAYREWAAGQPELMTLVKEDALLSQYEFLFQKILQSKDHLLGSQGEAIMARMELSGGNAWSDLHGYLTSTVEVPWKDGTVNLSAIRNLAYDPDGDTRRQAYEAELDCYSKIRDSVAFALNSIKLETLSDCALRGYASPLERTLKHSDMEQATLDAMLEAIREYLPKFWQYLSAKAKALGYENGLPWYDLFAPMGKAASRFTPETAGEYLVKQFSGFDQELADMVSRAFRDSWIDFYPRSGKSGGAFCAPAICLGESRILTNFDGQFTDVVTLAHELGHAFHNQCMAPHRILNHDCSMPVAETASTFNECVVMAAAIDSAADKEERIALIESQLQDVTQIICDIYSRYLFESMVFENRQQRFLDADTLCGFMTEAQCRAYGTGLDRTKMHPYMWVCKSHYYGPTFYNFPYAFGGLFARGLYAKYKEEGPAFVPKYKKLLLTTPVAMAEDAAKIAGIDLTDRNFWRSALQIVADQIDLFCDLVTE